MKALFNCLFNETIPLENVWYSGNANCFTALTTNFTFHQEKNNYDH